MIKYNLTCKCGGTFESWFLNSSEFDILCKKKLVKCIYCESSLIKKSYLELLTLVHFRICLGLGLFLLQINSLSDKFELRYEKSRSLLLV